VCEDTKAKVELPLRSRDGSLARSAAVVYRLHAAPAVATDNE